MNKVEKVTIDLGSKNGTLNPPVQFTKKIGSPDNGDFDFLPKAFLALNDQVISVVWRAIDKTLDIIIKETANFDVYRWIEYVAKEHDELQKSPFVDTNNNLLLINFKDGQKKEIAQARFKNLNVLSHSCTLTRNVCYGLDSNVLIHELKLQYSYIEFVPTKHEEILFKDDEWKTVETP